MDPGSIPGSRRSTGEGIGYPLQYSWAFLVAQLVKNPPAMQETWLPSLGWGDPLEKRKATHSSIQPREFHGLYSPWGSQRAGHDWMTYTFTLQWEIYTTSKISSIELLHFPPNSCKHDWTLKKVISVTDCYFSHMVISLLFHLLIKPTHLTAISIPI